MTRQTESLHQLIAHFLAKNEYGETLKQFEKEHGQHIEPSTLPGTHETLEAIIADRINFLELEKRTQQLNLDFVLDEHIQRIIDEKITNWPTPSPHRAHRLDHSLGLIVSMSYTEGKIYLSTNNMKFAIVDAATKKVEYEASNVIGRVVIKSIVSLGNGKLLLVGMNGKISLCKYDTSFEILQEVQAHKRLVVDAKTMTVNNRQFVVSLGWDSLLKVLEIVADTIKSISEITITGQASCIGVVEYDGSLIVVVGKEENTMLDVLSLTNDKLVMQYKLSLNDAEFSSTSFSPRSIDIKNMGSSAPLVAVGTSHEPYMRLIVVTLSPIVATPEEPIPIKRMQIVKNLTTMSPQDKYSKAVIFWRKAVPNHAEGVWIIGDDGIVRGIDLRNDKVVVEFPAHDGKIKNGAVEIHDSSELLITTGIDKEITLWTIDS
jgi:hypothetical protein